MFESPSVLMLARTWTEGLSLGKKARNNPAGLDILSLPLAAKSCETNKMSQPKARPRIDSTLYFIERDGDDLPLTHFEKFDIT